MIVLKAQPVLVMPASGSNAYSFSCKPEEKHTQKFHYF